MVLVLSMIVLLLAFGSLTVPLQAAATKLVQLASKFPCDILVSRAGQAANAKSVMGVLLLCGSKGTKLDIEATGEEAAEAVSKLGELINNRFGEDE